MRQTDELTPQMGLESVIAAEAYLWACARAWPAAPPAPPANIDGDRLVAMALANKMARLLHLALARTGALDQLPTPAAEALAAGVRGLAEKAATYSAVLQRYMPLARERDVPTLLLKGLWVACRLYGDPAMRPGHDMDILVGRSRVDAAIAIGERLGFGRYWPQQLADGYYRRHHLHLELCLPDCWTWLEIHWALDHPRTRLTIDYDALLARCRPAPLQDAIIWEPTPADALTTLAVHLVKHAVYLPATVDRADLGRVLVADGRLLNLLDIARLLHLHGDDIDWAALSRRAAAEGTTTILGAVLRAGRRLLAAPVDETVLARFPVARFNPVVATIYNRLAAHLLAEHDRRPSPALWRFLVSQNDTFIVRPIRLLDFAAYAAPGRDYLHRRYGRASAGRAATHLARAVGEYGRLAAETLYYVDARRRRPLPVFLTRPGEDVPA